MEDGSAAFFLLCGSNIQKWCISSDNEKVCVFKNTELSARANLFPYDICVGFIG